ncbi:MAG: twin-arginine translocase TatA/TatE family subunit [Pseudomonadales bacterium]|nr:twin-arginine translocase TatA/TatE family subunit [Pseudomonadales bacterium]
MGLGGISIWQLLIILVIVMLIFGTKRLKGLGGDIGGAIKGFRDAMNDDKGKKDEPERLDAQTDARQRESSPADSSGNHKNP